MYVHVGQDLISESWRINMLQLSPILKVQFSAKLTALMFHNINLFLLARREQTLPCFAFQGVSTLKDLGRFALCDVTQGKTAQHLWPSGGSPLFCSLLQKQRKAGN